MNFKKHEERKIKWICCIQSSPQVPNSPLTIAIKSGIIRRKDQKQVIL